MTLDLNKKHVLFQVERSEEVLKTCFLVTIEATSPPELKKTFSERTQRRFGKFLFCSRNNSRFYKYSISQDISNARCKEPKYQTWPSKTSAGKTQNCSRIKIGINSQTIISKFSQQLFHSQLEKQAKHSSKRRLWASLNVILRGMLVGFGDIGRPFSKICTETFKKNVHNPKRRRPRFQKMKNCFFNIWYCISQIHDLKPIIKRSFRQSAQPKRDSAFEQKTRTVSSREIWGSSQNSSSSYNQGQQAHHSSKRPFWNVLNVVLESLCFPFGEIAQ